MAKKKKTRSYGEGMSSSQIIHNVSLSIGHMKESTLRQAVTRLSSAMNKRLDRAAKAGNLSPAMEEAMRSGGRFSAKGKSHEELKAEFIRLKQFATDPTSTHPGWNRVQKEATKKAMDRGIIAPPPPPPKPVPIPVEDGVTDFWQREDESGERSDWSPVEGWTWDEESRSWMHPDHGKGWIPYEEEGGGFLDPITGEIVGNEKRAYHDYDASLDERVWLEPDDSGWGFPTETGKLWSMVDDIAKMDVRFKRSYSYLNPLEDPRMRLFDSIDEAWVENPGWSFEEARDSVLSRLNDIFKESEKYKEEAKKNGTSGYFRQVERNEYDS